MPKKNQQLNWIDIVNPTLQDLQKLQKQYNFTDMDIDDCLSVTYRSKIAYYDHYIFAVFLYPKYVKETREIIAKEFDFWVGKNYLISTHDDNTDQIGQLFNEYQKAPAKHKKEILDLPPEKLLYEIQLRFLNYCSPMIKHIDEDLDNIEKKIFAGYEKRMVKEISIIRRNITDYRKIVEPHKYILKKLKCHFQKDKNYAMSIKDVYFDNLIDYTEELWNTLENFKERIEALQETNESLISFKINDTMSFLTMISIIAYPANLIAAIFGANTVNSPITDFWHLIFFMFVIVFFISMIWVIRTKRIMK